MRDPRIERLRRLVRDVADFPKPGITFKDITPVLGEPGAFRDAIDLMAEPFAQERIDAVLAVESRGFIFGAPLALAFKAALVPIRKPGKLPYRTRRVAYQLEYGSDALEMHQDALLHGAKVLLVDDVLATGGTAQAAIRLAEEQGAQVIGASFLLSLDFLQGVEKLASHRTACVLRT
jgi:adenine phosphoribosyltransferase